MVEEEAKIKQFYFEETQEGGLLVSRLLVWAVLEVTVEISGDISVQVFAFGLCVHKSLLVDRLTHLPF